MKNKIVTVKGTREFYPEEMALRNYINDKVRAASQSFGYQEYDAQDALLKFCQNDWIRNHHNLILIGPTGIGKSYLACALGNSAIRQGISTVYVRMPRLAQELKIARADGSYVKLLQRLQRTWLLIVDDWGLSPFTDEERRDFLEIMEDRHQVRSTIIASQLPIDLWHDMIGDPTLAYAICDRVLHNAHKIILTRRIDAKDTLRVDLDRTPL